MFIPCLSIRAWLVSDPSPPFFRETNFVIHSTLEIPDVQAHRAFGTPRTTRDAAWRLLAAALLIGIAGDALLRGEMPRLGSFAGTAGIMVGDSRCADTCRRSAQCVALGPS